MAEKISADLLAAVSAPRGPVPTRISLRTRSGACTAISCATLPPIEYPRTSALLIPSALMKAIALVAMAAMVAGVSPELAPIPALSNKDDFALLRQPVGHRRIPMVHGAAEMDIHDDRHAAGFAEAAIGKADSVGLDELGRDRVMRVGGHGEIPRSG